MRIRLRGKEKPALDKDTLLTESAALDEAGDQPEGLSHRQFLKICGLGVLGAGAGLAAEMVVHPTPASAYTYNEDLHVLGKLGVGTTSPSRLVEVSGSNEPMIRITNTGMSGSPYLEIGMNNGNSAALFEATSGKDFKFYNGQYALTILGSNGRVGIGTTNPAANLHLIGSGTENVYIDLFSNDTVGPRIRLRKARGTLSSPVIVQNDDELGYYLFRAYDGSAFLTAAWVGAFVDGTPGANSMPTRLVFATTASGAMGSWERMTEIRT